MKKHTRIVPALLCAAVTVTALPVMSASAVTPNPVISRNVPAYSGTNPATATAGNDEHYFSFWQSAAPDDYLAYDLSGVPEAQRQVIDAVWYNTSAYDVIGMYVNRNMEPSDYTIEVNAAPGGDYPADGWEVVETVTGNTLSSRQHVVDFAGYNWIRIHVTGVDEKDSGNCMINFDIHNVSDGVSDSWLFLGDSITAGGMNNCYGTGFATYLNRLDAQYFPVQENGGIGGITSTDGVENIDRWLSTYPGKYVSIAYGTNDCWGNPNNTEKYYNNTKTMIDKILEAGKIPVLPKIPGSTNDDVAPNVPLYNAKVEQLWEEYGDKLIQGPDFQAIMEEHPEYLSNDGVHPCSEGYEEMRRIWAETMYERVYSAGESAPSELRGDTDGNGRITLNDLVMLQKYLVKAGTLTAPQNADLDRNGTIDIFDLAKLKHAMLG
ncbi:MAG: lysophospholipase [Oscillospiraceae bacterium]|nr:lysophospholipase [Oscillospiraceae bacterium]